MKQKEGECLCCAICCDLHGHTISASANDIQKWRLAGRKDLLDMVGPAGELWMDSISKERLDYCPWLERRGDLSAVCSIQEQKPEICSGYPTELHGNRCVRGIKFR